MALDIRIKPVEALLFCSEVVAVGKFRCPATHSLFRDSGPCSHHTFVFPRSATEIRHEGGRSFIATPGSVALYNQHQLYTRTKISSIDASDWYTIADDVLIEMLHEHDRRAAPERPFRIAEAPSDPRAFLEQRVIFEALQDGREIDSTFVEETILRVLARVVAHAYESAPVRLDPTRAQIDAVEHVRRRIACDPSENMPLRALARACGLSPFRLCRLFRARTGQTITQFRHSLRLRLALERLSDSRIDLTGLALDLGYASHSHFTFVFRRHFGTTPSAFRAATM